LYVIRPRFVRSLHCWSAAASRHPGTYLVTRSCFPFGGVGAAFFGFDIEVPERGTPGRAAHSCAIAITLAATPRLPPPRRARPGVPTVARRSWCWQAAPPWLRTCRVRRGNARCLFLCRR